MGANSFECAELVSAHQSAVAHEIGSQNGREAPLDAWFGHQTPVYGAPMERILSVPVQKSRTWLRPAFGCDSIAHGNLRRIPLSAQIGPRAATLPRMSGEGER
jgi:hypothetical protein